jgi:hypothetical protein
LAVVSRHIAAWFLALALQVVVGIASGVKQIHLH